MFYPCLAAKTAIRSSLQFCEKPLFLDGSCWSRRKFALLCPVLILLVRWCCHFERPTGWNQSPYNSHAIILHLLQSAELYQHLPNLNKYKGDARCVSQCFIMTCTDLMDSVIRVCLPHLFLDYLVLKSCQTKMDEFLWPNLWNHSQEIYRSKTVAEGEGSQLLKWFINTQI